MTTIYTERKGHYLNSKKFALTSSPNVLVLSTIHYYSIIPPTVATCMFCVERV